MRPDAVEFAEKGQVEVHTPFDPRTGQRVLFFDELELSVVCARRSPIQPLSGSSGLEWPTRVTRGA
jgi:hypothetical protein